MARRREQHLFWPSYADLMTSLFAIALVLFVLTYWILTVKYRVPLERIKEIEKAVAELADDEFFVYQPEYKRHVFRQEVTFDRGDAQIDPRFNSFLIGAGRRIESLIRKLTSESSNSVRYLIVIEGMASKDGYVLNYELSYQRALALLRFWQRNGIAFDSAICEFLVAGSGIGGVGRRPSDRESENQRFLIQIMPKIGTEGFEK